MTLEAAIEADKGGFYEEAARLYEENIVSEHPNLEAILNLVILYWDSTDVGTITYHNLSGEFIAKAAQRIFEVLELGERLFPENTEIKFWKRYISQIDLGDELPSELCRKWLIKDPTSLIPAMSLIVRSQGKETANEAKMLYAIHKNSSTARSRYILSIIEDYVK